MRYISAISAGMPSNTSGHFAISQYPRPGAFPTEHPNSDEPHRTDINIMGYSLRVSHFRYTIWLGFNAKLFKRSEYSNVPHRSIDTKYFVKCGGHFMFSDWHKRYGEELYDHSIDPDENLNLAHRYELAAIKLQLYRILRKKLDN